MGTTAISRNDAPAPGQGRPFAVLVAAAEALRPARTLQPTTRPDFAALAAAAPTVAAPAGDGLGRLLAEAADVLDGEQRHRGRPVLGGTTTTALTLARARGGSVAVSDARIELGLASRRRLARAGATAGADFDGDRLRVQPTGAADDDKEPIT